MEDKDFLVKDQDTRDDGDTRVNQDSNEDQECWFFELLTQFDPIMKEFERKTGKKTRLSPTITQRCIVVAEDA